MGLLSIFGAREKRASSTSLGRQFQQRLDTYLRMIRMTESQIPHQSGHSERVAEYTRLIAERMGIDLPQVAKMVVAAQVHDVGKVALSGTVLGVEGELSNQQAAELRRHPTKGAELLQGLVDDGTIVQGVLYHHERWDGSGYPEGLAGEAIPLTARIIGVADVFEALISQRSYRKAFAVGKALEHFENKAGVSYDPAVVNALLEQWQNAPLRRA